MHFLEWLIISFHWKCFCFIVFFVFHFLQLGFAVHLQVTWSVFIFSVYNIYVFIFTFSLSVIDSNPDSVGHVVTTEETTAKSRQFKRSDFCTATRTGSHGQGGAFPERKSTRVPGWRWQQHALLKVMFDVPQWEIHHSGCWFGTFVIFPYWIWLVGWNQGILWLSIYWEFHHPFQTFFFPFSWEFHHPNWLELHDFSEG